ncbi:DUF4136 domain-containing protein [Catalinimonas niigatensis]|uniref:DUF4136 domain-containing protein n=1 Tax=Catalinimonas niigatensis TaxID=1397264 RepID=UPI0026662B81|nr:DUF4136 domain-containing protein [Catalinimonas niigatensis]WPP53542.1 DUF4136 domain-containing protein [Catalinimonas niigatensis]
MHKKYAFMSLALYLCILALISGCSPVNVISSNFDPDISPESYETFNFYDLDVDTPNPEQIDTIRLSMLKNAIENELNARGLEMSDDPDLWVNIGVLLEDKVQTRETNIREAPLYIGQRNYHWESKEVVVDKYREGTVMLDLIDADSKEMVGQAVASGIVSEDNEKLLQRIEQGVEKVFDELWSRQQ